MNPKPQLVEAKGTPEAFLVPQPFLATIQAVAAASAISAFVSASVLVVCVEFAFRIVTIARNPMKGLFLLFSRPGNQVVRKCNIEDKIRADSQFDLPV